MRLIRRVLDDFRARRLRKKISPQRRKLMTEYDKARKGHRPSKPYLQKLSSKLHEEMKKELRK